MSKTELESSILQGGVLHDFTESTTLSPEFPKQSTKVSPSGSQIYCYLADFMASKSLNWLLLQWGKKKTPKTKNPITFSLRNMEPWSWIIAFVVILLVVELCCKCLFFPYQSNTVDHNSQNQKEYIFSSSRKSKMLCLPVIG